MNENEQRDKVIAQLLRDAAAEIRKLRVQKMTLAQYRSHTERLLALFEGGPPQPGYEAGEPDLAYKLDTVADGFEKPEPDPDAGDIPY